MLLHYVRPTKRNITISKSENQIHCHKLHPDHYYSYELQLWLHILNQYNVYHEAETNPSIPFGGPYITSTCCINILNSAH
jgi:hypothetical protein